MRIVKIVFLILGILCILIQLLGYAATGNFIIPDKSNDYDHNGSIGYTVGYNLFLIIGFIFLFISYRISKKTNRKKDRQLVDTLFADHEQQ